MKDSLAIDPARISERPQVFEGTADLDDLPGLEDLVARDEVALRYRITARLDPQRRKVLSCIIEGFVFLTCQRSMEEFRHEVSIDEKLVLVERESQLPAIEEESDAEDYRVAGGPVDVLDIVEEAVLLALPMVPRKPGLEAREAETPATRASPFAALERLRKKTD